MGISTSVQRPFQWVSVDEEINISELLRVRGDELFHAGCYKEAIAHYQGSLRRKPNQPSTLHGYGASLYRLGCPEEALKKLNLAASLSSNPRILVDRALVLIALQHVEEALEDLNKAVACWK